MPDDKPKTDDCNLDEVHILFEEDPDEPQPRLVEVEDKTGHSIDIGEMKRRPDGLLDLTLSSVIPPQDGE